MSALLSGNDAAAAREHSTRKNKTDRQTRRHPQKWKSIEASQLSGRLWSGEALAAMQFRALNLRARGIDRSMAAQSRRNTHALTNSCSFAPSRRLSSRAGREATVHLR